MRGEGGRRGEERGEGRVGGGRGRRGEGWWRQKNTFASEATPLQTLTC